MRFTTVSLILAALMVTALLATGCADVKATRKVGDFGTAFGATAEEQKAIGWFKTTYGDPTTNNDKPARFVEPLVTTGLSDKNLPVDKVTTFPVSGGSVSFFVIYDNFKKGDPITVSWIYLENGKEVTSVKQEAGGDFGRFIVEFQKPDTGWGKGKQRITVTGDGATATADFAIGDTLATTPLPYNPAGESGAGTVNGVTSAVTTAMITGTSLAVTTMKTNTVTVSTTPTGTTCSPPLTLCDGKCVNLQTDMTNCGRCGHDCLKIYEGITTNTNIISRTCSAGQCLAGCLSPYGSCVEYQEEPYLRCETWLNDNTHCGSCSISCPPGYSCRNMACVKNTTG